MRARNKLRDYARKYGVLGLCGEHQAPEGHRVRPGEVFGICAPEWGGAPELCRERVDSWRYYAGFFGAVFRLASAIYSETPCDARDWSLLGIDTNTDLNMRGGNLGALATMINGLLTVAPLQPTAGGGTIVVRLATSNNWSGLFGGLAALLLFAVSKVGGLQTCSSCGGIYRPVRSPVAGRNRYCSECGLRAAWRTASAKRYRKKIRQFVDKAHLLHAEGQPIAEIAHKLNLTEQTVARMLGTNRR
jgi:hypothetical protein